MNDPNIKNYNLPLIKNIVLMLSLPREMPKLHAVVLAAGLYGDF